MRYRKSAIFAFSILLAVVAFWNYKVGEWGNDMPLTAVVTSGDNVEELVCWKDPWNNYCFFLPSYADLSMVQIRTHSKDEIWLGDHMLTPKGLSCDCFNLNAAYGLTRIGRVGQYGGTIRFIQSGNVPTMYIDVQSGNMEYIHQKKGNEETGTMRLYTANGYRNVSGTVESLKGRGNATWEAQKKSYSLTLSEQSDLLGMGKAQRWILLSNGYDPSSLRNKIGYDLAKAAGLAYSPDSRWVDLYLNGAYTGLYLLCERNEVHPERVAISADNSFLISRERADRLIAQNYPYVNLKYGKAYRIHHSSYGLKEVEEIWMSAENALLSENGTDPRTGKHWTELIDLDSWAERYLIDEITANSDGGRISQFYYYDGAEPSGRIYAGPVWDLDITFGWDWATASPQCFSPGRPIYPYGTENSPFDRLYQKEEFRNRVVALYQEVFRPLLIELNHSGLDYYIQEISPAVNADHERWLTYSPEKHNERIKQYLAERISFLDAIWLRGKTYCDVRLILDGEFEAWFAVWPGECLPEIPEFENAGWYVCGSDMPFDITQPIYESVDIYLKQNQVPETVSMEKSVMVAFAILMTIILVLTVMDKKRNCNGGRWKQ